MAASGQVNTTPADLISFNELAYLFVAWSKENNDPKTASWYLHYIAKFDAHYDGAVAELRQHHVERG